MRMAQFIVLGFILLCSPASAERTDIVESYTMEEMHEMATLYKSVTEKKALDNEYQYMRAGQFRGYVAAILDLSVNQNKTLVDCAKKRSLNFIAYRVTLAITGVPLDRSMKPVTAMMVSVLYACDDSQWTKN